MTAALAALATTPAAAQSSEVIVTEGGGSGPTVVADVQAAGAITVEFHGDRAAGCEAAGNCDVSGVVEWTPGRTGFLTATRAAKGSRHIDADLDLGDFGDATSGTVAAVQRGATTCTDATGGAEATVATGTSADGRIHLAIHDAQGGDLVDTRCEGPLMADVQAGLGAAPSLPLERLRPGARFDFSSAGTFSAGGLAGTVSSTLRVRVARLQGPGHFSIHDASLPTRGPRVRLVSVDYAITQATGSVPVAFAGVADQAACMPLDSCGVRGTSVLAPRVSRGFLSLLALAPARRPRRDVLAALGLSRRGNPRGVAVNAVGSWDGAGTVTTDVARAGAPTCHDSAPLTTGLLMATRRQAAGLRLHYEPGSPLGMPRTRCSGPFLPSSEGFAPIASGAISFAALRRPLAALHLRTGANLSDDGYAIVTHPDVAFALERRRVRESTFRGG